MNRTPSLQKLVFVEPETRRFYALMHHFRDNGCCPNCAPYWAIMAVEKELGREATVPLPVCLRRRQWKGEPTCEDLMRASWKARPKKEARRAA